MGLLPQISGYLIFLKFTATTVFIDRASDYIYIHLQVTQDADDTTVGKVS